MRATSFTRGYVAFSESKIRKSEISKLYSQMNRIWHGACTTNSKRHAEHVVGQYFRLEVSDCASTRHLDRNTKLNFQVHRTKNVATVCICCNPRIDGDRKLVPGVNYDTKQQLVNMQINFVSTQSSLRPPQRCFTTLTHALGEPVRGREGQLSTFDFDFRLSNSFLGEL